jgi:hypothetical protein
MVFGGGLVVWLHGIGGTGGFNYVMVALTAFPHKTLVCMTLFLLNED